MCPGLRLTTAQGITYCNIKKMHFTTECIFVFHLIFTVNLQHEPFHLYSGEGLYSRSDRNCICVYV